METQDISLACTVGENGNEARRRNALVRDEMKYTLPIRAS